MRSAICTISIPRPTLCPAMKLARNRSMDSAESRRISRKMPRLVRRIRVPQGLSRRLRFRHHRSERRLFGYRQRTASTPPAPDRLSRRAARRPSIGSSTRWYACSRRLLSFTAEEVWGYLCKPAGSPDERPSRAVARTERTDPGHHQPAARAPGSIGTSLMAVRDQVLKALEVAREEKRIGKSLEARVRLDGGRRPLSVAQQYAADLPALFIVSQVRLEQGSENGVSQSRSSAPKATSASAAGNTRSKSAKRSGIPDAVRRLPMQRARSQASDMRRAAVSVSVLPPPLWCWIESPRRSSRAHLSPYDTVTVIPGLFNIVHTENPGIAFGMLANASGRLARRLADRIFRCSF